MADDEDDPMAFLAQKREQMAAMAEMAQVAQMQAQLAADVKDRMARISQLRLLPRIRRRRRWRTIRPPLSKRFELNGGENYERGYDDGFHYVGDGPGVST